MHLKLPPTIRCSSAVECRSQSREPGSNPAEAWAFSLSPRFPSSLSCINDYLAIDSGAKRKGVVLHEKVWFGREVRENSTIICMMTVQQR